MGRSFFEPDPDGLIWVCDSPDHNENPDGCSNPHCFKHPNPDPRWAVFAEQMAKDFFARTRAALGGS